MSYGGQNFVYGYLKIHYFSFLFKELMQDFIEYDKVLILSFNFKKFTLN